MTPRSTDTSSERVAISLLEDLGLSEYEARCLVALVNTSEATAAQVSEAADVPRPRVYDTMDSLDDRNLVEVCAGTPRRFRALPVETILDAISMRHRDRVDRLGEQLEQFESDDNGDNANCRVWQLSGRHAIEDRLVELVRNASSRIDLLLTNEFITEEYVDILQDVDTTDVDLTLLTEGPDLASWLEQEFPNSRVMTPPDDWTNLSGKSTVVHLVFVDWERVAVVTATQETPASQPEFDVTISEGDRCGFVITLKQTLQDTLSA